MFKRLLLTTDGSPVIERQILYAEHLVRVEQAELFVLHVYEPPVQYTGFAGYEQLLQQYHALAQAVVDDALSALRDFGMAAQPMVRSGTPGPAIVAAAHDYDIDLIVMGMRSGHNLQAILGSVSAYVLRNVHCSVLQIP